MSSVRSFFSYIGGNRSDPGAGHSSGDGKSWSKTETVFEKWRETSA